MRWEFRERFPRLRLQRKARVSDPDMHHGTCVAHVPWCMSGSLTSGGGENLPGIPGACATCNFTYRVRGPWQIISFAMQIQQELTHRSTNELAAILADDICKCIFLNEKCCILIPTSLKFVPKGSINNKSSLAQAMAWRRTGDKPLSESMLTQFTDACMRN